MGHQMEEEKQVFYTPIFAGYEKCRKDNFSMIE